METKFNADEKLKLVQHHVVKGLSGEVLNFNIIVHAYPSNCCACFFCYLQQGVPVILNKIQTKSELLSRMQSAIVQEDVSPSRVV